MLKFPWFENPDNKLKFLILGFIILLLPFLALSLYTFPTTDDYCHALAVLDLGYWNYQEHYWNTWSGRYIGTLISATQPLAYGSYLGYKIAPMLVFILYAFAIVRFAKALTMNKLPTWQATLLAFLLLFIFIAQLPNLSGYFYWYTGYYYTLADIGTLFLFAYFFHNYNTLNNKKVLFICLAIVVLVGTNEFTLVWLVCLTGSLFFFDTVIRKKINYAWLAIFLTTLICGVLSVTAPGNHARAESGLYPSPLKSNLMFSLTNSIVSSIDNFSKMAPILCVLTLVLIPIAVKLNRADKENDFRFLSIHPIISIIVFMGCLYVSYFPSYWSIAQPPNLRAQGVITFWTLIGWTFNVFVLSAWIARHHQQNLTIEKTAITGWIVAVYFVMTYLSNFNYRSALSDLFTGRAARFNKEMQARTELVLQTKGDVVNVPKLENTPYTILIVSGESDPAWASVEVNNGCAEWYFKKKFFYK